MLKCAFLLAVLIGPTTYAAAQKPPAEPQVLSIFPLGNRQGTAVEFELRGQSLEEVYALWFDCSALSGRIRVLEQVQPRDDSERAKKAAPVFRVLADMSIAAEATPGIHSVRVVSPRGVSNPLPIVVHREPVVTEELVPEDPRHRARRLPAPPVVVSGRIGKEGEVDFYSFETAGGQELFFEVVSVGRLDPQLAIHEPSGSWFDPRRLRRLAFNDEPNTASKNLSPSLTHRFETKGRFLVSVGSFLGRGGPDFSYQLRVVPAEKRHRSLTAPALAHETGWHWEERSFERPLDPDSLEKLWSRSVRLADPAAVASGTAASFQSQTSGGTGAGQVYRETSAAAPRLARAAEKGPNDQRREALEIQVPSLIEGTIERPGDADWFRFRVKDGAKLAFELETPGTRAPYFTPRLGLQDESGLEFLNNIYAFVQGSGEFIEKVIEPKITFNFERGGEYWMVIEDLTSRNGAPDFRYRVLVRPQIPHAGKIEVGLGFQRNFDGSIKKGGDLDRINLAPGEAKRVSVLTEQEEGFDGEIAIAVEGLPQGVEAYPATQVEPERPRVLDEGKKERFRPGNQVVTIVFAASPDARRTRLPQMVRLKARAIVKGRPGRALPIHEVPMMVVRAESR